LFQQLDSGMWINKIYSQLSPLRVNSATLVPHPTFREICVAGNSVNESEEVRVFLFPIAGPRHSTRKIAYSVDYGIKIQ